MKNHFKKLRLLVTIVLLIIVSCSKEDATKDPVAVTGGEAFRSQIMTVELPNSTLSENEYQGTLDGVAVTLTKSDDNKLLFLVPYSTTTGVHTLTIPAFNNVTISYDVKNTVLSETPGVTMIPLFTNWDTFSQTLDSSPEGISTNNSIANFKEVFDKASLADKTKIAILYKANKSLFDNIILNNYSNVTGRLTANDIVLLAKHSHAVWVMAAGALVTIYAPEPIEKAFGIAITAAGAYKAYKFFGQLTDEELNCIFLEVGGLLGVNNKVAASVLSFDDNITTTINLNTKDRKLIASDISKTQTTLVEFFKIHNTYNYYIGKINGIVQWVNSNVLFANFDILPLEILPESSSQISNAVNSDVFENIQFSISHPNLQLVSSTLQSDGQLSLKIKIIGTPASLPVESFLNYSYSDNFSSFSGKLPIKVTFDCTNTSLKSNVEVNSNNASATVSGGIAPYKYLWSNGAVSQSVSNLLDGIYELKVTDAVGCEKVNNFSIAIDSTAIYKASALSKYTVKGYVGNGPNSRLYCELKTGGVATYTIYDDPSWADGTSWNVSWTIQKQNKKYYYSESGWWNGYPNIKIDSPLIYPVTSFNYHINTTYSK